MREYGFEAKIRGLLEAAVETEEQPDGMGGLIGRFWLGRRSGEHPESSVKWAWAEKPLNHYQDWLSDRSAVSVSSSACPRRSTPVA